VALLQNMVLRPSGEAFSPFTISPKDCPKSVVLAARKIRVLGQEYP
jgi:hypothetical protein